MSACLGAWTSCSQVQTATTAQAASSSAASAPSATPAASLLMRCSRHLYAELLQLFAAENSLGVRCIRQIFLPARFGCSVKCRQAHSEMQLKRFLRDDASDVATTT